MKNSNKKGFTLVELVVVIAIIGVLAAILVPSMMGYVKKSRLKTANGNAKTAYNAAAEALTDMETQGVQMNSTWSTSEVDCTSVGNEVAMPTSASAAVGYLEYCLKKNLGPNGKDGGFAWVGTDTGSTAAAPVYYAQWHKTTTDDIKGQYPEAPATVAISQSMTFGTIYHGNGNQTTGTPDAAQTEGD